MGCLSFSLVCALFFALTAGAVTGFVAEAFVGAFVLAALFYGVARFVSSPFRR